MKWIEPRGQKMPIIGQPTQMECWITCYQMLFKASDINWNLPKIEEKLVAGGFSNAKQARISGIGDSELLQCAEALGTNYGKTGELTSVSAVKMKLKLCGPLWVAGHFQGSTGSRYKHVVMVIGVEEEGRFPTVAIVNPWQENLVDRPEIGWMGWNEFQRAIQGTSNTQASLQYLLPLNAFNMKVGEKFKVETMTYTRTPTNVYVGKI